MMACIPIYNLSLIIVLLIFTFSTIISFEFGSSESGNFNRVCYYREEILNCSTCLTPNKLDLSLCTHIILGFAAVFNNTLTPGSHESLQVYSNFTDLKQKAPSIVYMLSVGGGGNADDFSDMVTTSINREMFIIQSMQFLRKYKFDGIDFDWEFPVWKSHSSDKVNFIYFLKEFRAAVDSEPLKPGQKKLVISVAVCAAKSIIDIAYDIPGIALSVDFVNLMSYDYHHFVLYDPLTGFNSPLYKRKTEILYFATQNIKWSANHWVTNGMPKSKLMVGLPMYAHTYTLLTKYLHGLSDPAIGNGMGNGDIDYSSVCNFLIKGAIRVFNNESQVPYAYLEKDWISFEDIQSITEKSKFIIMNSYGGAMTFDLNTDDWQGTCDGKTTFPLHKIILKILKNTN